MIWPLHPLKKRHYRVAYLDPAWKFSAGPSKNPNQHYRTMTVKQIQALPIKELAHPEGCRILMWTTMPHLENALKTFKVWGVRYSTARVWGKLWQREDGLFIYPDSLARGTGYEVIGNAEMLLIGKVGKPERLGNKKPASLFFGQRREHSRKPDHIRDEIKALFKGPRCELFARHTFEGWDVWGDQTEKFNAA